MLDYVIYLFHGKFFLFRAHTKTRKNSRVFIKIDADGNADDGDADVAASAPTATSLRQIVARKVR